MLGEISTFLLTTLTSIIVFVILLRFFLQLVRANFRNPLAQAIVQLTSPLVVPVRRVVPAFGKFDTATLLVAYVVQLVMTLTLTLLQGVPPYAAMLWIALFSLVFASIQLFTFAIIISVIISWIAPGNYNPASALVNDLVEPLLRPIRSKVPPMGGLDLSPLLAILALGVLQIIARNLMGGFSRSFLF
ncbi:MAG: YggT family protein [Pseudomonadota bacterium]